MSDAERAKRTAQGEASTVVIGNFDGVHRGHQEMIRSAARQARAAGLSTKVLTFHPHPARVLGRTPPALLTRLHRKRELVAAVAPDVELVVKTFDLAFAGLSPRAFAELLMAPPLSTRRVVVGSNFRFGKGRAGDLAMLRDLGRELGFEATDHELVGDEDGPWSSTRVRKALAGGDLEKANELLGRPHMVSGVVEPGDKRGRTIGFPTANITDIEEVLPPNGVYAVVVDEETADEGHPRALAKGVANIGHRPTVDGEGVRLEVHLFDLAADLYGRRLRTHFVRRLREERKFDGLAALKAQIAQDADAARAATDNMNAGDGGRFF